MEAIAKFLTLTPSKDEFVPSKFMRALEASLHNDELDEHSQLLRIATLDGFYKDGVEYSLSVN
jgi:hypothetical protein